jgi:diguanylate cyclase (GGDEF)-like protein
VSIVRSDSKQSLLAAVRAWPVWANPPWLIVFIAVLGAIWAISVGRSAVPGFAAAGPAELVTFGVLIAFSIATVEITRRAGENTGLVRDIFAVWELPIAILLPTVFGLLTPTLRFAWVQWRVRRIPIHRRIFSMAAVGLSYGSASWTFHLANRDVLSHLGSDQQHAAGWVLAVAVCSALQWAVNHSLVLPAIKSSNPTETLRKLAFDPAGLQADALELCVAVLVTLCMWVTPLAAVFAFPFVTLLQRSQRHSQLVSAARIDSKTNLLNAGTWEREANAEVVRAVRTRSPLAVALLDIDNFKTVNDTYGHLAGDKALKALARTITAFLREYDLVGRFGGEEFALLLPQTGDRDAFLVAERMREHIATMPIEVGSKTVPQIISITVSIGVAALSTNGSQLTELLATADAALYRAKHAGRNQVWVTTDTASFSSCGD